MPFSKFIGNVVSFTDSATKYIKTAFVDRQAPNVPLVIQQDRLDICASCEHYISLPIRKCNECGCFLDIKTLWATEKCPIDKWAAVDLTSLNKCGSCH